jgi:tetratricopeptide (TPR) repeat protein
MRPHLAPAVLLLGLVLPSLAARPAGADFYTWVDEDGRTHMTDDPEAVPPRYRAGAGDAGRRDALWDDGFRGPPLRSSPGSTSSDGDRAVRLLRGAADDLRRGETARATTALRAVLALEPDRAEAHWYLALLDRQRGRFDSAETHLRAFLDSAGDDMATWRASAEKRLAQLADERALAAPPEDADGLQMVRTASPHFRILYDVALGQASPDYLATVTRYLEEARAGVGARLGVYPQEPTRVFFYGKGAYRRAHAHRFSFRTVGFYDGRIHVASAGHPGGELRSLLHHEYTHALFREVVGSDRPMWLNEGLAELSERASRGQPSLSRGERSTLHRRVVAGSWIPLARLGPGFGGLSDDQARLAYLQAIAAARWIEDHTSAEQRARILVLLGQGSDADHVLRAVLELDVEGLERAVQDDLRAEFPSALPAAPAAVPPSHEVGVVEVWERVPAAQPGAKSAPQGQPRAPEASAGDAE